MKVSKYWYREKRITKDAKGYEFNLTCWAGSSHSLDDAKKLAIEKLSRWTSKLSCGERIGEYEYQHGEIREELIEEIFDAQGKLIGAVTRNRYGALILNATGIVIADIDANQSGVLDRLLSFFGRKTKDKAYYLDKVRMFSMSNPDLGLQVYETHSGLRVFVTNKEHAPDSVDSQRILAALESDKLYQTLCLSQKCYRARLTPKPWRCKSARPPNSFPRQSSTDQRLFEVWLKQYADHSKSYAVCKFVASLGQKTISSDAKRILDIHDAKAVASGETSLA